MEVEPLIFVRQLDASFSKLSERLKGAFLIDREKNCMGILR